MQDRTWIRLLGSAALATAAASSHAIGVTDAVGDFVPSYTGVHGADLDVIGAFVTYNAAYDAFVFSGTVDANIGSTAGAFYVFGVNRGAGTANLAGIGATGVLFDSVVVFNQDGSGTVNRFSGPGAGATPLAAGTAQSFGSTIIGVVSGSLLPTNGWAKADYTWNLWPRLTGVAGSAAVSDFAPDNSNVQVVNLSPVPEPATALLLAAGLAAVGLRARRRQEA